MCLNCFIEFVNGIAGLALLDFQARVSSDPYLSFKSWNSDDYDPCSWSHVQCVFGHVQAL